MKSKNRVAEAIMAWEQYEKQYNRLFSPEILNSKTFMKERLGRYDLIIARYKGTKDQLERPVLNLLKAERTKLARELYPGRILRIVRSVYNYFSAKRRIEQENRQVVGDQKDIQQTLKQAGLSHLYADIARQIKQGETKISVNASKFISANKEVVQTVQVQKSDDGRFSLASLRSQLMEGGKPGVSISLSYPSEKEVLSPRMVSNLLSGRAVLRNPANESNAAIWLQIDPNDKDAKGNLKIRTICTAYSLSETLKALKIKELKNPSRFENLIVGLTNGERMPITITKGGKAEKLFIEADPAKRGVAVYDVNNKKLNATSALNIAKEKNTVKIDLIKSVEKETGKRRMSIHRGL